MLYRWCKSEEICNTKRLQQHCYKQRLKSCCGLQVDGKPIMQTVWPQGSSSNFWQWTDLAQQYSDMWSGTPFQNGSTHLSISGQTQQISISSIVNAPFEVTGAALVLSPSSDQVSEVVQP